MSPLQLAIAHAVKVAVAVLLVGLLYRHRARQSQFLVAYFAAIMVGNWLVSLWPERFYTWEFYTGKQIVYDLLKLGIGLELAYCVFRAFQGARGVVRVWVLFGLVVACAAFASIPLAGTHRVIWEWQARVYCATIALFTGVAVIATWFGLPIRRWHRVIAMAFPTYMAVHTAMLSTGVRGLASTTVLGLMDGAAYLLFTGFLARQAWRPQEEFAAAPAVLRRLGLQET